MGAKLLPSVLFLTFLTFCDSDSFDGIFKLKIVFQNEGNVLMSAVETIEELKKKPVGVDPKFMEFERFIYKTAVYHRKGVYYGESYMEHPINIYHVVKRMTQDWPKQVDLLQDVDNEFYNELLGIITKSKFWPQKFDYEMTKDSILRIQTTYNLDFHQLATGTLNHTHTDPLTLDEIAEIARFAYEKKMLYESVVWSKALVRLIQDGGLGQKVPLVSAMKNLALVYFQFGNYKKPVKIMEESIKQFPEDKSLKSMLEYYQSKLNQMRKKGVELDKPLKKPIPKHKSYHSIYGHYNALCRGDVKTKPDSQRKLSCRFKRTSVPYRPAKLEVLNRDPLVVMFHDVIYDNEIEMVKKMAKPNMKPSGVLVISKKNTGQAKSVHDYRVSVTSWLDDSTTLMSKISRRVAEATGLSTKIQVPRTHAESAQILNYGIGGMYEPHWDYFLTKKQGKTPEIQGSGDRLATWMFYLSDVAVGGKTVFVRANVTVPVVKGSAVFWPNFFLNGTHDRRTMHAGCPVVIGSKWVMNKWIRNHGQFNKWPCPKQRYQRVPKL